MQYIEVLYEGEHRVRRQAVALKHVDHYRDKERRALGESHYGPQYGLQVRGRRDDIDLVPSIFLIIIIVIKVGYIIYIQIQNR